jgi:hypothetical protein
VLDPAGTPNRPNCLKALLSKTAQLPNPNRKDDQYDCVSAVDLFFHLWDMVQKGKEIRFKTRVLCDVVLRIEGSCEFES